MHRSLYRIQHNLCVDEFNICVLWNRFWTNFAIIWHVCSSIDHVHVLYYWSCMSHFLSRWPKYDLRWMEYDGIFNFYLLDVQYQRTSGSMARKGNRALLTVRSSVHERNGQGSLFKGHFTIAILNGFYNSGSGLFIIVKLLYIESKENSNLTITVPEMLMIWSTFIIFPIVKTFFFSPL